MSDKKVVFYHGGGCLDGFASAWLFRQVFPQAVLVPIMHHDTDLPKEFDTAHLKDAQVIFVDVFPRPSFVWAVYIACSSVMVLDHHSTAEPEIEEFAERAVLRGDHKESFFWMFDKERSGCQLAWDWLTDVLYVQGRSWESIFPLSWLGDRHTIIEYVGDRDLWLYKLPQSREINAYLRSEPLTFERWDWLFRETCPAKNLMIQQGGAILRIQEQSIESHVRHAKEVTIDGFPVLLVNCTDRHIISEVAGRLAKDRAFGATWFDTLTERVYSLRSSKNGGIDVGVFAKKLGGGGHKHAAGFSVKHTGSDFKLTGKEA